jgi:hypothetical protein
MHILEGRHTVVLVFEKQRQASHAYSLFPEVIIANRKNYQE